MALLPSQRSQTLHLVRCTQPRPPSCLGQWVLGWIQMCSLGWDLSRLTFHPVNKGSEADFKQNSTQFVQNLNKFSVIVVCQQVLEPCRLSVNTSQYVQLRSVRSASGTKDYGIHTLSELTVINKLCMWNECNIFRLPIILPPQFTSEGCGQSKSCILDPPGCDPKEDPHCFFLSMTTEGPGKTVWLLVFHSNWDTGFPLGALIRSSPNQNLSMLPLIQIHSGLALSSALFF